MEDHREYIYPFESVFCYNNYGYSPMYLAPEQSRYHNLGMNGYITVGRINGVYPDKRPGFLGDYGPRQESDGESVRHGVYPLDIPTANFNYNNDYRMAPYVQPQKMSVKSLNVLNSALHTCPKDPYS